MDYKIEKKTVNPFVFLSVPLFICMSFCIFVCPSLFLSVSQSICLLICLNVNWFSKIIRIFAVQNYVLKLNKRENKGSVERP